MAKIIILFGSFILFIASADEVKDVQSEKIFRSKKNSFRKTEKPEYLISDIYRTGEYLIYDCKKRHFACVNKESFVRCKEKRQESFRLRYSHHPCVPLKNFKEQDLCFKKQLELIEQIPDKKFCINTDRKLLN